jgi:hypothetical protein
MTIEDLRDLL